MNSCHLLGKLSDVQSQLFSQLEIAANPNAKNIVRGQISWWFRGIDSDCYHLTAKLFCIDKNEYKYPTPVGSYEDVEQRLIQEYVAFTRKSSRELDTSEWDRMIEMQHYSMPTRLLDWSTSIFTALSFMLKPPNTPESNETKGPDTPRNTTLWILNPRMLANHSMGTPALNDIPFVEHSRRLDHIRPWTKFESAALDQSYAGQSPNWILDVLRKQAGHYPLITGWSNPRVAAQFGCFTLQGGESSQPLDQYVRQLGSKCLLKVRLAGSAVEQARTELKLLGGDIRHQFPEPEFIAKSIMRGHEIET